MLDYCMEFSLTSPSPPIPGFWLIFISRSSSKVKGLTLSGFSSGNSYYMGGV
jgi:hypothetical protein